MVRISISGTFEPIELWQVQNGNRYTDENMAKYRAQANGDSCTHSGGYPQGPTEVYCAYRRVEDGKVFIVQEVRTHDAEARKSLGDDLARLKGYTK